MPIVDGPYTDVDYIKGIYLDPENEILLAEYALQTGGIQLGLVSAAGAGTPGASSAGGIAGGAPAPEPGEDGGIGVDPVFIVD